MMNKEGTRVLSPKNIQDISNKIVDSRKVFISQFEDTIVATRKFSLDVFNAIGEISVSEAKEGIIDFFAEAMRKQ